MRIYLTRWVGSRVIPRPILREALKLNHDAHWPLNSFKITKFVNSKRRLHWMEELKRKLYLEQWPNLINM